MSAAVDIAGAVAPAAALPASASNVRAEGTSRSGHASAAAKGHGAKGAGAAKAGTDTVSAFDDFDTQLDAALPGVDDTQDASAPKGAARNGVTTPKATEGANERNRDQAPAAAVIVPWTFVQLVDVAPVKTAATATAVELSKDGQASTGGEVITVGSTSAAGTVAADTKVANVSVLAKEIDPVRNATDVAPATDTDSAKDVAPSTEVNPAEVAHSEDVAAPNGGRAVKAAAVANDTPPQDVEQVARVGFAGSTSGAAVPQASSRQENAPRPSVPANSVSMPADASTPTQPSEAQIQQPATRDADQPEPAVATTAPPGLTTAVAATAAEPRVTTDVPDQGIAVVPAAHAPRGEKAPAHGRSTASSARPGTRIDGSQPQGQGKDRHTPRLDASANAGPVDDQRRGAAPMADSAAVTPQAMGEAKPSAVRVQEPAPAVLAVRDGHVTTGLPAAIGATRSTAADVVISGDVLVTTAGDVPEADTANRLVQSIRMQFLHGGGDAIVQLRPDHLGPVTVSLRVEQGSVEARITAANPVVAEWLQAHHETLREGLQANGLTLDRLLVDRDGRSPDRRERREPPQRQRFRPSSEAKSTFELTI